MVMPTSPPNNSFDNKFIFDFLFMFVADNNELQIRFPTEGTLPTLGFLQKLFVELRCTPEGFQLYRPRQVAPALQFQPLMSMRLKMRML